MYSHKHGADYTTVHYMVHVHYIVHVHVPKLMVPFLIAGHKCLQGIYLMIPFSQKVQDSNSGLVENGAVSTTDNDTSRAGVLSGKY